MLILVSKSGNNKTGLGSIYIVNIVKWDYYHEKRLLELEVNIIVSVTEQDVNHHI